MKSFLFTVILAAIFCVALSQEAQAQIVGGSADISYYEPTNSMYVYAEVFPDYSTQAYYCVSVTAYIYKNGVDEPGSPIYADNRCEGACWSVCGGRAVTSTFLPYDPSAEYTVEANQEATVHYRYVDESGGAEGYYDYYDFFDYMNGDLVYYPAYFDFASLGGPVILSVDRILLGVVYSIFTAGATAGPPHHLRLVSDTYRETSCGSVRRWLKFRVVDASGRNAATRQVRVEETFETILEPVTGIQYVYNSCQDRNYYPPSCAGMDLDGTFTDQLWVGCPSAGGDCGFQPSRVASVWWWCRPRGPRVRLTRNIYEVTHSAAIVNQSIATYPPGTEFY